MWRTRIFDTPHGKELQVVQDVVDEIFRDEKGDPTAHPGLQIRLSDAEQLCRFLNSAELKVQ